MEGGYPLEGLMFVAMRTETLHLEGIRWFNAMSSVLIVILAFEISNV
jgi:hypothetical protein